MTRPHLVVAAQSVLSFLTFELEIQAELKQQWPKNPGKHLQNAHEVPVLVDNGNIMMLLLLRSITP